MRTGALPGFVGVQAALDTPHDRGADDRTESGVGTEGAREDRGDHVRDDRGVHRHYHDRDDDVDDRHEGHDDRCEVRDPLDATDDHQGEHDHRRHCEHPFLYAPSVFSGDGHRVGLHAGKQQAARENGHGGEEEPVELEDRPGLGVCEGSAEVIRRSAAVFTGEAIAGFVDLSEGALDERRRCAEKRHEPHPEKCSWSAEGDRGCDTSDVAGADASSE